MLYSKGKRVGNFLTIPSRFCPLRDRIPIFLRGVEFLSFFASLRELKDGKIDIVKDTPLPDSSEEEPIMSNEKPAGFPERGLEAGKGGRKRD